MEVDGCDDRLDPLSGDAEDAGEVAQILPHRQVALERRRLRHITYALPQRRVSRLLSEHHHGAAGEPLHATIERISVVLPEPLGPSRPVTVPAAP